MADMKNIAAMLACPHQWGPKINVTLVDGKEKRDGALATCSRCGTHRIVYADGSGALLSPDAISSNPAEAKKSD